MKEKKALGFPPERAEYFTELVLANPPPTVSRSGALVCDSDGPVAGAHSWRERASVPAASDASAASARRTWCGGARCAVTVRPRPRRGPLAFLAPNPVSAQPPRAPPVPAAFQHSHRYFCCSRRLHCGHRFCHPRCLVLQLSAHCPPCAESPQWPCETRTVLTLYLRMRDQGLKSDKLRPR